MSTVYKSDHFKVELDTEHNMRICRRDRVFIMKHAHKAKEALCIQALIGGTVESRDRQACRSLM